MPRKTYGLPPGAAARLFHVLGSETRLRLMLLLAGRGERSVGDLVAGLAVTQPAVSQHLRTLHGSRLVACRREGRRTFYRLASPAAADVLRLVCGP